jgi:predicted GNAT family N-acyltransferase
METPASFSVRRASWQDDRQALRAVRLEVFVREQSVPENLEWDELDAVSLHVVAEAAGAAIGTGRLLPDGHIGRMAVLAPWRGRGVGSALFRALLEAALAAGHEQVRLSAQVQAVDFYRRFGFATEGPAYMEAGIAHIDMRRELRAPLA